MRLLNCIPVLAAAVLTTSAQSNFDPAHAIISVESIGALHWSPTPQDGAVINQYYAAGYIYGGNIGWISLGAIPLDKFRYSNNSATDFGVNVTPAGELRGFAYGANVGWINFETVGNPRVDWATGRLTGRAWSANLGWIDLESGSQYLQLDSLPAPPDSDGDGLPDAWEMFHASNLTSFSATTDRDSDRQSDLGEFLAGTNPTDPEDFLWVEVEVVSNPRNSVLQWPTKPNYIYYVDQRASFQVSAPWSAAVAQPVIGNGSPATVTIPSATNASFYRVRAYPPLSAP